MLLMKTSDCGEHSLFICVPFLTIDINIYYGIVNMYKIIGDMDNLHIL